MFPYQFVNSLKELFDIIFLWFCVLELIKWLLYVIVFHIKEEGTHIRVFHFRDSARFEINPGGE